MYAIRSYYGDSWWGNSGPVAPAQVAPITLNPYVTGTSQSITITPSPVTLEMDGRVIDERVISFTTDQNRQAIQDITSTTVK